MSTPLVFVVVAALAYLAAHVVFGWLARRFLIVSGAEYLLLGIVLGPQGTGVVGEEIAASFAPFLTLAVGWIGAVVGSWCYIPDLVHVRGVVFRIAFVQALATYAVAAAACGAGLAWLFHLSVPVVLPAALALGALATASGSAGVELIAKQMPERGPIVRQLEVTNGVDAFVAITGLALVLCLAHPAPAIAGRPPTATEWAVITVAIGVVGGALFHLFLGEEREGDRLFIGLAGAIILTSGAASYLRLSPLLPAMLVGAVLVNTNRNRREIRRVLATVERPLYFVLLVFAGALWRPSTEAAWAAPVVLFLAARAAGKVGGARLAARLSGELPVLGPNWGRGLLGQGGLAIALALTYLSHDGSPLPNLVFTAAVASVLLTDLLSARLVRSVVRDDVPPARPARGTPAAPAAVESSV